MIWIVGYALAGMILAGVAMAVVIRDGDQIDAAALLLVILLWPAVLTAALIASINGGR